MSEAYRAVTGRGEAGRRLVGVALAGVLAACLAGCSFGLPGVVSAPEVTTGSITRKAISPLSPDLGQEDWRRARGALAVALDPQGNGSAVSWDNPESGLKGTFTPVAQPYVKDNDICRAFLATLTHPDRTATLQGAACRMAADDWDIKDLKPFRKPA